MLRQIYLQEVRDLAEYHGLAQSEITMLSDINEWDRIIETDLRFRLAVIDLDGWDEWTRVIRASVPMVLVGSEAAQQRLQRIDTTKLFLKKPLRFGTLLQTVGALLRLDPTSV
jgi:hypothetical protein